MGSVYGSTSHEKNNVICDSRIVIRIQRCNDSRCNDSTFRNLQLIQCAPIRFALAGPCARFCEGLRRFANAAAIAVATRMRGQIEQQILSQKRRQIDRLRPVQLRVQGKCRHLDLVYKFFETRDTAQLHPLLKRSVRPKRAGRNSDVDVVRQRPDAADALRLQFGNRAILIALQMQTFGWNLFQMNLHRVESATWDGETMTKHE
jgi:hypothetical protein